MSIKKRIQKSMLLVSVAVIVVLLTISLLGLFSIRTSLSEQMEIANNSITTENAGDMLTISLQLAESMACQNAQGINGDFMRIKGELLTLKGDIENLYNGGGLNSKTSSIQRYEEYIVSQASKISEAEIEQSVNIFFGVTAMFDNVLKNETDISLAYVVLENGMVFSSTDTFYPDVEKADMRTRDWYKDTIAKGDLHWSELYSGTDGRSYVTVSIPVVSEGNIFGVLAFDLRVSEISDVVLTQKDADFTDAFIISGNNVLLSTRDIEETANSNEFKILSENVDFQNNSGCYEDGTIIAGYATIDETGWTLINLLDFDKVTEPVREVANTVTVATNAMQAIMIKQILVIIIISVFIFVLMIFTTVFISRKSASQITKPLLNLNESVKVVAGGNLGQTIEINTGDEIETLANSFNKMTYDLRNYIDNLASVTAEKERIGAELGVATQIQASMLPSIFPAFPEYAEFDLYATMTPAKEVGGDFYDFFLADENHLVTVIADVSGKGVPAALFMVIAKTLLKNAAQIGLSPKEILEKVNNQLCENNEAEMFVTVWLGILEISTGKMVCANAGHEYPVIKKANGNFELLKDKHGFVLAGLENAKYREYEINMEQDDVLYVYTDGVVEATDEKNVMFGVEKMLTSLNKSKEKTLIDLLHNMKKDIDIFVGNAPQFDDITMLSIKYKGGHPNETNHS